MKLIRFTSHKDYESSGQPVPAKKTVPQWFKDAEVTFTVPGSKTPMSGLKKCIPYLDVLTSGYMLVTPADIYISQNKSGDGIDVKWDESPSGSFIDERPKELGATMPRPEGFAPNHMVWVGRWGWKVPRGYSVLVTHPFNRLDLPFHTQSAIIDSDSFFAPGNIPFFINKSFSGKIPKGTPFAQLLPIKRDSWKMVKNDQALLEIADLQGHVVRSDAPYRMISWFRKKYD